MRVSTFIRHKQSEKDAFENHMKSLLLKLLAAGIVPCQGGYPVNPDQTAAYNAGYARGSNWAYETALQRKPVETRWDMNDGTYDGQGEQDGWNAVVDALK